MLDSALWQPLSRSSLVFLLVWDPLLHTPYNTPYFRQSSSSTTVLHHVFLMFFFDNLITDCVVWTLFLSKILSSVYNRLLRTMRLSDGCTYSCCVVLLHVTDWLSCGVTSYSTQNRSFRRRFPKPTSMEKTKLNATKACIHRSKEMYDTKYTQKTKARFSRLLWHPAWNQASLFSKEKISKSKDK